MVANEHIVIKVDNPAEVKARGMVSLFKKSKALSPRDVSVSPTPPLGASGKVTPINELMNMS